MKYKILFYVPGLPAPLTSQLPRMATMGKLAIKQAMAIVAGVCLFSGIAMGAGSGTASEEKPKFKTPNELPELMDHKYSDRFLIVFDPATKQQLGEDTYNEIVDFFDVAEDAIDIKDLKAHMATYSENFNDGEMNKQSIEEIWKKIFAKFERVVIHQNLRLVTVSTDKQMVILRSSGLLLAEVDPKKNTVITIDNWTNQDIVLIKEGGKWKFIGTFGEERKRLWFDKPMHPLF